VAELQNYFPDGLPIDPQNHGRYLHEELVRLSGIINLLILGQINETDIAPTSPREGMIRLADGTNWDPGHGEGMYFYYNSQWYPIGGRGLYASAYTHNVSATLTLSVADTDRTIPGLTSGPAHNIVWTDNERFVVSVSALYVVKYSVSFSGAVANDEFETGVVVGSTLKENTTAHRKIGAAFDVGNMGGTGIVTAAAGDSIALVIRNHSNANDAVIEHVNFTIEYIDKS